MLPDETVLKDGACVKVAVPASRVVFAPTGPLNRDQDDVRRFADAAAAGIKRSEAMPCFSRSSMT